MLNKNQQAVLLNLCMQAELEHYNPYWVLGFAHWLNIFDKENTKLREKIINFLANTNDVTRKLYLELCYVRR